MSLTNSNRAYHSLSTMHKNKFSKHGICQLLRKMTIKPYNQCDNMGGKDSGREDSGSRNKETCNFDWKGLKKALQTQYHWGRVLKENIPLATKKGNASQLEVTIITKEKKKKHTAHWERNWYTCDWSWCSKRGGVRMGSLWFKSSCLESIKAFSQQNLLKTELNKNLFSCVRINKR